MSERSEHRVTVTRKGGFEFNVAFEAVPGAAGLLLDEPAPLGGARGPNATDMVLAAVANCLAASLLLCLQKGRAEVQRLTATAVATLDRNEKGRLRITRIGVDIAPGVGAEDAAKLARCRELFEDFCIVTASVRQGIPVDVRITT